MSKAKLEIETLRSAIEETGVVVRIRTDSGKTLIDIYWSLPKVEPKLRHFINAGPYPLIRDFSGNDFWHNPGAVRDGLFDHGILSVAMISDAKEALEIARSIARDHELEQDNNRIKWADK